MHSAVLMHRKLITDFELMFNKKYNICKAWQMEEKKYEWVF